MKRPTLAAVALALAAAPASASAASLEVASPTGSPVITYAAGPGEVNRLRMEGTVDGPFDLRMEFFEFGAPQTAGAGCIAGFPVICGEVDVAFPVEVSLGDERDVANVNSFTGSLRLDAGPGSDDVLAGGIEATADGGSGNDTIRMAANLRATGSGGSGNDRIAAGLGARAVILDGGSGDDLLVPGAFLSNQAGGGVGDDRLVNFTGDVTLSGDAGSDVLVAQASNSTLNGGSGSDIAFGKLGGITVDAGPGHDVIDVRGASDTSSDSVTCGSGLDIVWANRGDDVAADCELRLGFTTPALSKVTAAVAAAETLLAHTPDPSQP
jgi:Ca2+-binding RTX toxin-like protein